MKFLIFLSLIALTQWNLAEAQRFFSGGSRYISTRSGGGYRTLGCSGGACGGTTSCSGGACGRTTSCSGGACGGTTGCSGGGCGSFTSCSGGNCNIDATDYHSVQTCPSCVNNCVGRCNSKQCINGCLGRCICDNDDARIIEDDENIVETDDNNNCCYVVHPKTCYTEDSGSKRCFARRHRECSNSCTSNVVSIQETEGTGSRGCQFINNYPYAYCGNYERRSDCGNCYTCGGRWNPEKCSKSSGCSDRCRQNIVY